MNAAVDVASWLAEQERKELLRFITCGIVDDGKSTLIGRLLFNANVIMGDQLEALKAESRKFGTTGDDKISETSMEDRKREGYF